MSAWHRFDVQAPPCDGWYELRWPNSGSMAWIGWCARGTDPELDAAPEIERWTWALSPDDDPSELTDDAGEVVVEWRLPSPEWLKHVAENLS